MRLDLPTPYKVTLTTQLETSDVLQHLVFFNECVETVGGLMLIYTSMKSAELDMQYLCKHESRITMEQIEIKESSYNELF